MLREEVLHRSHEQAPGLSTETRSFGALRAAPSKWVGG